VGKAMAKYFQDHYTIVVVDPLGSFFRTPDGGFISMDVKAGQQQANECDLAVVCVPTPMQEDGSVDTSIVEEVFGWLTVSLILIKSTIPPGTCEKLTEKHPEKDIVFSPEYIGEGRYYVPTYKGYPHPTDMKQHEFFIFGGNGHMPGGATGRVIDFFMPVSGPDAKYMQTNWRTAELVKYMENSWGATKVTFFNEFFEIAHTYGVDYKELRELFLLDGRTERMHTAVFEDRRGFDGKCYPKDVNGIVQASSRAGYVPRLLEEVLASNDRFRQV
jgi:UDPglucose 6-dehydrogenase